MAIQQAIQTTRLGAAQNDAAKMSTAKPQQWQTAGAAGFSVPHFNAQSCKAPAMANGRCRIHGGESTGPRTAEGLARSQRGNWKHGEYSQEFKAEMRSMKVAMGLILSPDDAMGLSLDELDEHLANLKRVSQKMKSGEISLFRKAVKRV